MKALDVIIGIAWVLVGIFDSVTNTTPSNWWLGASIAMIGFLWLDRIDRYEN